MNYVHQVRRSEGVAKEVTANANGVYLTFIKGKDGRPLEVSRYANAMVYTPGDLYVRKDTYSGIIRQVAAVLNEKAKQHVGFKCPPLTQEQKDDACIQLDFGKVLNRLIKED